MRHPDCEYQDTECRITTSNVSATNIVYKPVFDGTGARIDSGDPNIVITKLRCATCRRVWCERRQYGQTEVFDTEFF